MIKPVSRLNLFWVIQRSLVSKTFAENKPVNQSTNEVDQVNLNEVFDDKTEEFPVLKILPYGIVRKERRIQIKKEIISPRYTRLSTKKPWGNVWPTARNFHPDTVPLPIHMSYVLDEEAKAPIGKYNNPELLKIPNFLHLTPPVVKKQCQALKRFCTKWPEALKTDEDCDRHFPVNITTKDFVFSGPSIRWADARIVELTVRMSDLKLDEHARDKMKRLLRHRYNTETDLITIRTDSCPLRQQNYEYAQYLLTALYFESWKKEEWESEKEYSDWERYFFWDQESPSRKSISLYLKDLENSEMKNNEQVKKYAKAVTILYDQPESKETLEQYKKSVIDLFFSKQSSFKQKLD